MQMVVFTCNCILSSHRIMFNGDLIKWLKRSISTTVVVVNELISICLVYHNSNLNIAR